MPIIDPPVPPARLCSVALTCLLLAGGAALTAPAAEADDAYDIVCIAGEPLYVRVWNAKVVGFAECGGQTATCSTVDSADSVPECVGRSPGGASSTASGKCGYTGSGTPFTFTVECWSGSAACSDGLDNDADGFTDYGADPGCSGPTDLSERGGVVCDDALDNDADGLADFPDDPGCASAGDADEKGTLACDDGTDNDRDGSTDFPADPGCTGPGDADERGTLACDDGTDNDGDGTTDQSDPGCSGPGDASERGNLACDNGADDDGDGAADMPHDPGCSSPTDPGERGSTACDDNLDNDGDARADYPSDIGCTGPDDSSEGACEEAAPGVKACLEPGARVDLPPLFIVSVGDGARHTLVADVEVYNFVVPGGPTLALPCVRLRVDGDETANPCAEAGGVYARTLVHLATQPVAEPVVGTTPLVWPIGVCSAELTLSVHGLGVPSSPAYAVC